MDKTLWSEEKSIHTKRSISRPTVIRKCFLCNQSYAPLTKCYLFCEACEDLSERYRFSDWMLASA